MFQDQEEIHEVSNSLASLKKKHDAVKKQVLKKEESLEQVKKEIQQLGLQEGNAEFQVFETSSKLEQLKTALSATGMKSDEEEMNTRIYQHMLDRMKKDIIAMSIKQKEQEKSLKQKDHILHVERDKSRKTKEQKLQSKAVFDQLMKNIDQEQKDRKERIFALQKSIKNKEESVQRRMERIRRQQEIAEAAANENKDSTEKKMRETFMLHKLWSAFMRKKMDREMSGSHSIDEAFKKIKTATGVTDVQELVQKFLTREQTYSELLLAVSDSERRIDQLKKDNEQLRARLHELQMDSQDNDENSGHVIEPEDIIDLRKQLDDVNMTTELKRSKFYNVEIVNDQVSGWAKRVSVKIDDTLTNDQAEKADIVDLFELISTKVCEILDQVKEEDPEEPAKNIMNDFLTDDFVNKNIRVRPISGRTVADETKEVRSYGSRAQVGTESQEDQEDNSNKMDILELEEQRGKIKDKRAEFMKVQQEKKRAEANEKK